MYRFLSFAIAILAFSAPASLSAQEKTLTVYTYDAFAADWGPGPGIEKAFEEVCDCDLNFVVADSSIGILRKIQFEGAETSADIALGLDTNLTEIARESGLFMAHNANTDALRLPIEWSDEMFLPFDYGYFGFVYNKETVKNPPTSFDALIAMDDDFKIVIQDPRSSTVGLGMLLWIKEQYGDEAASIWKKLAPKILTVTKGWSESYGLFLKGEAEMVLSYTTSPAYHLIAEGDPRFASAPFEDGHYMQVEVASIVKSTKQPELARQFMQFIMTDGFQDTIPTGNWMYPVAPTEAGLPEGFDTLHIPETAMLMTGEAVKANRKAWTDEWLDALGQ